MTIPTTVEVTEVGPRDGLQSEPEFVATGQKIRLINNLIDAGVPRIEFSSFVSPRAVPQLTDVVEVFEGINRSSSTVLAALVPNAKGAVRAAETGIDEIIVFLSASDSHNLKNVNRTVDESLVGFEEVARIATASNIPVQGVIATAFGCPFEGDVPVEQLGRIAKRF
ncbi:MAG: hydroxymethylglutaryl-CoA lyase, partial [Pseudomonadales bacterium]|nr:hydroxymethylglutaryl-CoA lyase [Pseudomonadales bacterium]